MGFLRFQRAHNFGELLFREFFWNRKNDFRLLGGFFQGEFWGRGGGILPSFGDWFFGEFREMGGSFGWEGYLYF